MSLLTLQYFVKLLCAERLDEHSVGASLKKQVDLRLMAVAGHPQDDTFIAEGSVQQVARR